MRETGKKGSSKKDLAVIYNRVSPEVHRKLKYIAKYEGRTVNGQALYLMLNCIREFEKQHGVIPEQSEENAP